MASTGPEQDVTQILAAASDGDSAAAEALFPLVYEELRRVAGSFMRGERADHTLQPTSLVHEAFLKLIGQDRANYNNRKHFLAVAATAMRRILVNHAAAKHTEKRGGDRERLLLDGTTSAFENRAIDLLALDDALNRLAAVDEVQARAVELRFFAGLTVEETAEILGVSARKVHYDWIAARAWLRSELIGDEPQTDEDAHDA